MKSHMVFNGCSKFIVSSMLGFGMLFSAVHAESPSASKPVASAVSQAPKSSDQAKAAPQNGVAVSHDTKPQAQQSKVAAGTADSKNASQPASAAQPPVQQGQAAPQQNQPAPQVPAVQNENKPANDASGQGDIFFGAPDPGSQQAPITPGESH